MLIVSQLWPEATFNSTYNPVHAVKVYVDMDVWIPVFSASVLGGGEWSDSRSGHVISGKVTGIHCLGGRVDLIADLGGWRKKISSPCWKSNDDFSDVRPTVQSLYRRSLNIRPHLCCSHGVECHVSVASCSEEVFFVTRIKNVFNV
jgi:hypothetical protein